MVPIFLLFGVALVASFGVLAAPLPRDVDVYGSKALEYALVRRAVGREGNQRKRKQRKEKGEVTQRIGWGGYKPVLPSEGTFTKTEFCPWGVDDCPKYGGWDQAKTFKKHMVAIHHGSAPDDWTPGPTNTRVQRPKAYVVGGGKGGAGNENVAVHTPVRPNIGRGSYKHPEACPWRCYRKRSKVLLTWKLPSSLEAHIKKMHQNKTEESWNYPATCRTDGERNRFITQVRQSGRDFTLGTDDQKRKSTSGSSSQQTGSEKSRIGQIICGSASIPQPPSFFQDILRKPRTPRRFINLNQPANQPTPNVDVDLSPNQPHNQPPKQAHPPLDLNEAPTWSGLTDPGFPGGGRDSGVVEAGPSASSRWPS